MNLEARLRKKFEQLKNAIENGTISTDLNELRKSLMQIDEGIFGFVLDPEKL